jgi:hypothetical protein
MTIKWGVRYAGSREVEERGSECRLRGAEISLRSMAAKKV